MSSTARIHEVHYAAPVPRGHEVLIAMLRQAPGSDQLATLVFDRTDSVTYCLDALWAPLSGELGWTDPIAALTRYTWQVESVVVGRVLGTTVATNTLGHSNVVRTRLLVAPIEAQGAYR